MITDIQQAVVRYAYALDDLDVPALTAVLDEDTTWTFEIPERGPLGPIAGRQAVLEFVHAGHAAQAGRVRHHLSNVLVSSSDTDTAEARAYLVQTRSLDGSVHVISTGTYTFGMRRSESGWRIQDLTLVLDNAL
ncbi:nuclear transport factor 2 family protein [Actinoplanes sp. LDG1-06]|uniref:Nuclear transport factor 2 family protein n=1 Tax=Paractinoplanes ovalisporus TaxID=2810368 RepID=A0ABS2AVE5_9ACTN|nr:nuclear transport factor 2 family protein [Actinoplanes ovalisporus]MBM2623825.1 nuclear transport factor 2 family protein [Actinoplanes ovalisporus]